MWTEICAQVGFSFLFWWDLGPAKQGHQKWPPFLSEYPVQPRYASTKHCSPDAMPVLLVLFSPKARFRSSSGVNYLLLQRHLQTLARGLTFLFPKVGSIFALTGIQKYSGCHIRSAAAPVDLLHEQQTLLIFARGNSQPITFCLMWKEETEGERGREGNDVCEKLCLYVRACKAGFFFSRDCMKRKGRKLSRVFGILLWRKFQCLSLKWGATEDQFYLLRSKKSAFVVSLSKELSWGPHYTLIDFMPPFKVYLL